MTTIVNAIDNYIPWVVIPKVSIGKYGKYITAGAPRGYKEFDCEDDTLEFRTLTPNCFVNLYLPMCVHNIIVLKVKTDSNMNKKLETKLNNTVIFSSLGYSHYFVKIIDGSEDTYKLEDIYQTGGEEMEVCYNEHIIIKSDAKTLSNEIRMFSVEQLKMFIAEVMDFDTGDDDSEDEETEHVIDNIRPQDSISNVGSSDFVSKSQVKLEFFSSLDDTALKELFVERYGGNIVRTDRYWYFFNGKFWERDDSEAESIKLQTLLSQNFYKYFKTYYIGEQEATKETKQTLENASNALRTITYSKKLAKGLENQEGILRNIKFDSDPWWFKYGDKIANIKTGEIRDPKKEDYITANPQNHIYDQVKSYLFDVAAKAERKPIDKLASEFLLKKNDSQERLANLKVYKTLLGAVWRLFNPGCKFDNSLILHGNQGICKSLFFNILAGGTPYFCDSLDDISSKDSLLTLHSAWIHEWSEIEHITNRKEAGAVKAFLTKTDDKFRASYDRAVESHKRRCIIVGTTNQKEFLIDDSGDRRFWVISCTVDRIDIEKLKEWRDGIWASAVLAWRRGEENFMNTELEEEVKQSNAQFRAECPWFDAVRDYITVEEKINKSHNRESMFRTDEILSRALDKPKASHTRADTLKIANIMRKLGYDLKNVKEEGSVVRKWAK